MFFKKIYIHGEASNNCGLEELLNKRIRRTILEIKSNNLILFLLDLPISRFSYGKKFEANGFRFRNITAGKNSSTGEK